MKLTMCEVVQQIEYGADFEKWRAIIEEKKTIKKACMILHDKDEGTAPHIHMYLSFGCGQEMELIAKWFDVPMQCIEKIKGRYHNALNYAIHKNAPEKHQYSVDECYLKNIDAEEVTNVVKGGFDKRIEDYVNRVITYSQLIALMTPVEQMKMQKTIELAAKVRNERKSLEEHREMKVIYLYGGSGTGKTTIAKYIAKSNDMDFYISSASNDPLCDYKGQKCIILDDLRANAFTFADLLKLTDNNTPSSAKSRYYNKCLDCEIMIITSVKAPWMLYDVSAEGEPLKQFIRRIYPVYVDDEGRCYEMTYSVDHNEVITKKEVPGLTFQMASLYFGIKREFKRAGLQSIFNNVQRASNEELRKQMSKQRQEDQDDGLPF